jgi:hypothetical protein
MDMKLSEIKGEQALDVLADIIEPASEIMSDKLVSAAAKSGQQVKAIKLAIKGHKRALIEIMAALDGAEVDEYEVNVLTLPAKLLEILNDPMVMSLFTSQGQKTEKTSSGSATENIEDEEQ